MKKLMQISVLVVLAFALVLTAFAFRGTGAALPSGKVCPLVGWNNGVHNCHPTTFSSLQGVAFQITLPPVSHPDVGWNS